jgi:hypothetical protein
LQLLFSRWALESGMSKRAFRRRSSLRLHYRILRSSSARRKLFKNRSKGFFTEIVLVQEFVDNIGAELERNTSVVFCPAGNVLVRVCPEQIAKNATVGDSRRPLDSPDLLHVLKIGREAAVAAEDFVINDRSNRKTVETIW